MGGVSIVHWLVFAVILLLLVGIPAAAIVAFLLLRKR